MADNRKYYYLKLKESYFDDDSIVLLESIRDEAPPTVQWSKRYKEARRLLAEDGDTPPDFDQAYALLQEEAESGNALAMYDLGRMFVDGLGRDVDESQGQAWYAKALSAFQAVEKERPNRYVEYRLGKMFAAGLGAEQDYDAAAQWLTKSAEQNYPYAQYSLAKLYCEGLGVVQDHMKAFRLYDQSAAAGFPYAAWELGKLCRDGVGCEQNERQASHCFAAAFRGFKVMENQGHDNKVQYRLGWMLLQPARYFGVGVIHLDTKKIRVFEKHLGSFGLGDFYIRCNLTGQNDSQMHLLIFYCPIRYENELNQVARDEMALTA